MQYPVREKEADPQQVQYLFIYAFPQKTLPIWTHGSRRSQTSHPAPKRSGD
jgi:hypothetical protein